MGLEFNSEQEQILSVFTAYRNDIDIYTEDELKDKVFYKRLFSRLLAGTQVKISDIYTLGSSDDVINACNNDSDTERKKLYIVDGDIYLMFSPKKIIPNLFVLDAYCIENLVIDEDAVCNTLCNFIGTKELNEIKQKYDFDNLVDNHKEPLITLFYYKALEKKCRGYFNLYSLATYYDKQNNLDVSIIKDEIKEIETRLVKEGVTHKKISLEINDFESKFPKTKETFMKIISGKDYLIHLISCHAKKSLNFRTGLSREVWKYNFANYCKLDRLESLKMEIIKISNSP